MILANLMNLLKNSKKRYSKTIGISFKSPNEIKNIKKNFHLILLNVTTF